MKLVYGVCSLNEFNVKHVDDKGNVLVMTIGDSANTEPTQRFWTSLCSNYSGEGLTLKLFNLFTHAEVFQRIHDRMASNSKDRVRYVMETFENAPSRLLAISSPGKAVIDYENAVKVLDASEAESYTYSEGIIRSVHNPLRMHNVTIAGDNYKHQFELETPVDGFGSPNAYLSLENLDNGAKIVAYGKMFRSQITLGKDGDEPSHVLSRALDSFNNQEGYDAIINRLEASKTSWASILESQRLYQVINRLALNGLFKQPDGDTLISELAAQRPGVTGEDESPVNIEITRAFAAQTGDISSIYSLTHIDALAKKRQGQLPCKCTVYDLIQFTALLATYYTSPTAGRLLYTLIADLLANEYDLEGTLSTHPTFSSWLTDLDVVS